VGYGGKNEGQIIRMTSLDQFFHDRLLNREQEDRLRKLSVYENLIDFCSNDYLGFARSEELARMISQKMKTIQPLRNGATGSRLLSGNTGYVEEVESKLARIFKSQASLIFNSGYAANQAVLSSIPQRGDTIIYDELAHACIKDGARLSAASRFSFYHNDLNDLEKKIKKAQGKIFIAVEAIYSMDGDQCPLADLITLSKKHNAFIVLDEAHSTGVLGQEGGGLAVSENLHNEIAIRIYTFGKAMGVHGACVAGSKELISYMINFARPFIYTTALPAHSVASIDCAFDYLKSHPNLQEDLNKNIDFFRSANLTQSKSAIQTVLISGNKEAKSASVYLQQKKIDIRAILSPTVPEGKERLRICLHAFNTKTEMNDLRQALSDLKSE
jgi:8-amino-7-oxononanoate synthase